MPCTQTCGRVVIAILRSERGLLVQLGSMALLELLPRKFSAHGLTVTVDIIASSPLGTQDEELRGHPKFHRHLVDRFEPWDLWVSPTFQHNDPHSSKSRALACVCPSSSDGIKLKVMSCISEPPASHMQQVLSQEIALQQYVFAWPPLQQFADR